MNTADYRYLCLNKMPNVKYALLRAVLIEYSKRQQISIKISRNYIASVTMSRYSVLFEKINKAIPIQTLAKLKSQIMFDSCVVHFQLSTVHFSHL